MIRYGAIGTNFIVDRFQEAAMGKSQPSLCSRLFQKSGDSQQIRGKIRSRNNIQRT
ncbi:MAG: hypothetical protein ACLR0U_22725 [Enterocloster clostridioformis]